MVCGRQHASAQGGDEQQQVILFALSDRMLPIAAAEQGGCRRGRQDQSDEEKGQTVHGDQRRDLARGHIADRQHAEHGGD